MNYAISRQRFYRVTRRISAATCPAGDQWKIVEDRLGTIFSVRLYLTAEMVEDAVLDLDPLVHAYDR